MSRNYFIQSLAIDNYRGLKNLKIERLHRINLIGGFNGTGKTTLLEAIFMLLDRRNPLNMSRPFFARNMQLPFPDGLEYVFGNSSMKKATITLGTSQGPWAATLEMAPLPSTMNASVPAGTVNLAQPPTGTTVSNSLGLHLKTRFNNMDDDACCVVQMSQEMMNFTVYKTGKGPQINGAILSPGQRSGPVEDAQRFSKLIKQNREGDIISALKFVTPELASIFLLQEGNVPVLYANMVDGRMLQTNMLGGGFQTILSIVLLMLEFKDGVILFDEIDSTIHYSKLAQFWGLIGEFANRQNCQVLAVTHSKECITNALSGLTAKGYLADLQYIRLESDDNETDAIAFSGQELADAVESGWEIR